MAYNVSSSIGELLYENNSVIVPNFGGFMLSYRSANIDHVQAIITIAVTNQVNEFNALIEEKEMLDIPKVGRLYKDYAGEIKFLPHRTNFNTNTFGLPQIQFQPVQRNVVQQEVPSAAMATAPATALKENITTTTEPVANIAEAVTDAAPISDLPQEETIANMAVNEKERFRWARKMMPFLIAASLALVAVSFYFLQKDPHPSDMESAQIVPVSDSDRLNTKPTLTSDEIPMEEDHQYVGPTSGSDDSEEYSSIHNDDDNSNNVYTSESNECVVIVGQFSVQANAKKFRDKVETKGYESYSEKNRNKGWTMVGVKFNYDSEDEKEDMLRRT